MTALILRSPLRLGRRVQPEVKKEHQKRAAEKNKVTAVIEEGHRPTRPAEIAHRGIEAQPESQQQTTLDGNHISDEAQTDQPADETLAPLGPSLTAAGGNDVPSQIRGRGVFRSDS